MLKHIVMWRLKELDDAESKLAAAKTIRSHLLALPSVIPEIRELEVGINIEPSDAAYDVCLYSVFASEADLETYQNHPDHKSVGAFMKGVTTERVVVDYLA